MTPTIQRAAIYARVSTLDQEPENQLAELRRYIEARHWTAVEYVDKGVSGAKDRRPALDKLLKASKRRQFDVLVCWRLDRLGRSLRHLILLLEELQALGVAFVSLAEGIDATTPAGRLQMHILGAIADFERARIAERVSRLLKNTRIGLFSWPSCVSRPPRQRCARGHAVPTRGPATPAAGDQGHLASRFRNRTKL